MLIIALPHFAHAAAQGYAHVHTDGQRVLRHATGGAAMWSAHAGEVVAVVPHSRLSWLRVQLPPASHGPRLSAVLHGLLEDRLLDEPTQLHIALPLKPPPSHAQVAKPGSPCVIGSGCARPWPPCKRPD